MKNCADRVECYRAALCSCYVQRKERETRLISQLGTVQPKGLNINFSFFFEWSSKVMMS